jgi:hypothetical protein
MRRRRREREAAQERLASLERRLEDLEDTVAAALRADRLDLLDERVDDLAMVVTTHEDLLEVRMHAARLAGEVARSVVELRADQARLHALLNDHVHGRAAAAG